MIYVPVCLMYTLNPDVCLINFYSDFGTYYLPVPLDSPDKEIDAIADKFPLNPCTIS